MTLSHYAEEFKDVQQGMTVSSEESTVSARKMLPILCKQTVKADSMDSETVPLALARVVRFPKPKYGRFFFTSPHARQFVTLFYSKPVFSVYLVSL